MMLHRKKPCEGCWELFCQGKECPKWQVWFLEAWDQVNRYAWKVIDEQGRREPDKFCYELPHMVRSPCVDCPLREWCETPCSKRLQWWDRCVRKGKKA